MKMIFINVSVIVATLFLTSTHTEHMIYGEKTSDIRIMIYPSGTNEQLPNKLPDTGDLRNMFLFLLGCIFILIYGYYVWRRNHQH